MDEKSIVERIEELIEGGEITEREAEQLWNVAVHQYLLHIPN